ncbi:unnamed protein product, partial [Brachionus calyciflorus]
MCLINEIPINFTIDSGAKITVISDKIYNSLQNSSPFELVSHEVAGAGGNRLSTLGKIYAELRIGETAIFTTILF